MKITKLIQIKWEKSAQNKGETRLLGHRDVFDIWLILCLTSEADTVEVVTCDSVLQSHEMTHLICACDAMYYYHTMYHVL